MTHIYKNIYLFTDQKIIRKLLADGFEYRFPLISHTREFLVLQCSEEFFTASKSGKKLLSEDGSQELLRKGYFKLTDESLRGYLDISSASSDKTYIQNASVEKLLTVDPSKMIQELDHDESYLDRYLDGATWPGEPSSS